MQIQRLYAGVNWRIIVALIGCVLAVLAWYFRGNEPTSMSTSISTITPAQSQPQPILRSGPDVEAVSEEKLKPLAATPATLENSDGDVIMAANDFAPQLVQWLTPSEQIRKWVALVDQIADGKIPQDNRPLDYPLSSFEVERHGDKLLFDNANYQRAEWLTGVLVGISPIRLAHYYHEWSPALEKAHAELGKRVSFDKQLHKAITNVLAVKPLSKTPELTRPGVYYQFADPRLESASDVEKLLWRIGPDNTQKLQRFLRELELVL